MCVILVASRGDATAEQKLLSPSWLYIPHYNGVPKFILAFPLLSPCLAAVLRVLVMRSRGN